MASKVPEECSLTITSTITPPQGYDLSGFLDRFHECPFMKISLSAFSVGLANTGASDYITVSVRLNADDPTAYGSERNLLYRLAVYVPAGLNGTANDLGSTTKYMIVNRRDLYRPLTVSFDTAVIAGGVASLQTVYAKLNIAPYYGDEMD